jgi:hypothetical protein
MSLRTFYFAPHVTVGLDVNAPGQARPVATKTLADVRMLLAGHVVAQTQSAHRGVPVNCNDGVAW